MLRSSAAGDAPGIVSQYPIAVVFAGLVFAALVLLAALRHLFGSIRVEGGTR